MKAKGRRSPPRLSIEITEEQERRLSEIFEHGDRRKIFIVMIDDFIELYDHFGRTAILMMLERRISYFPIMEEFIEKRGYK